MAMKWVSCQISPWLNVYMLSSALFDVIDHEMVINKVVLFAQIFGIWLTYIVTVSSWEVNELRQCSQQFSADKLTWSMQLQTSRNWTTKAIYVMNILRLSQITYNELIRALLCTELHSELFRQTVPDTYVCWIFKTNV